jgi:hypothetical protein
VGSRRWRQGPPPCSEGAMDVSDPKTSRRWPAGQGAADGVVHCAGPRPVEEVHSIGVEHRSFKSGGAVHAGRRAGAHVGLPRRGAELREHCRRSFRRRSS